MVNCHIAAEVQTNGAYGPDRTTLYRHTHPLYNRSGKNKHIH